MMVFGINAIVLIPLPLTLYNIAVYASVVLDQSNH